MLPLSWLGNQLTALGFSPFPKHYDALLRDTGQGSRLQGNSVTPPREHGGVAGLRPRRAGARLLANRFRFAFIR